MTQYQQRFAATARLYGEEPVNQFQFKHVVIIGVGGVGSWVAEALVRSGIGCISLIDADDISESNINRQIHSLDNTLGQAKVEAMKERMYLVNPDCKVFAHQINLSEDNCNEFLGTPAKIDYVIDAIDSVKQKAALIAYCKRLKIPIITTGGAGGLSDPTQIEISDLSKTYNDPLAAKVRYLLRSKYNYSRNLKRKFGIECVYSKEQAVYPQEDGSVAFNKPTVKGLRLDCNYGYGSSVCVTSSFAMVAVARVLSKLS